MVRVGGRGTVVVVVVVGVVVATVRDARSGQGEYAHTPPECGEDVGGGGGIHAG